jgi:hypothetical protein
VSRRSQIQALRYSCAASSEIMLYSTKITQGCSSPAAGTNNRSTPLCPPCSCSKKKKRE